MVVFHISLCITFVDHYSSKEMELHHEKTCLWVPTWPDAERTLQAGKIASGLKFCI